MKTKIGQLIKEEVERQGLTADQFAKMISTSRTNVYDLFHRDNIDMELLVRISNALHRNFFAEMYKEMAEMLGVAEPPATWANMKLKSLTSPLREELGMKVFSTIEWTKERDELKTVLREYFESDLRMPLLILESGYTFGAREVVKQVAAEVFLACGAAPCPKLIDVQKVKVMPEKVLVDYIDKNTFDSLSENDRRLNELCQIQKELTKKLVCVIHTDPTPFTLGDNDKKQFDLWGGEENMMLSRYDQCFITVYRWNRRSLLSWAEDTGQHEYVVNFIKNHRITEDSAVDYQLSHNYVSINQIFLGLPPEYMKVDYPTAHAYNQNEWEYASEFFREEKAPEDEFLLHDFIRDIIDFNEMDSEKYRSTRKKPVVYFECDYSVNDFDLRDELCLDRKHFDTIGYLYNLALQTDLKGLDDDAVAEQFYPWLKEHHPMMAQVLVDAANEKVAEELGEDPELRDYIPHYSPQSIDDYWQVKEGLDYHFILSGEITDFSMD